MTAKHVGVQYGHDLLQVGEWECSQLGKRYHLQVEALFLVNATKTLKVGIPVRLQIGE